MARKTTETIDEEELQRIVSGMSALPGVKAEPLPAVPEAARKERSKPRQKINMEEYEELFLVRRPVPRRVAVYVSEQVRDAVAAIVRELGQAGKLSAAAYIENVLRDHLEIYRDQINACYKSLNHKSDLL